MQYYVCVCVCVCVCVYTLYIHTLYLLGHKTCGAGGGSPEYLPIQHKGLFFAVEESVERFIICEVCGGVCPVSKETQCRGKKDLSGRKRDLLNTGIPLIPAAEPRCANTWALNSPCASMHACFVCVCVCVCVHIYTYIYIHTLHIYSS